MARRPLSKSELRLVTVFFAMIFIMGNVYGLQWLVSELHNLQLGIDKLRSDKTYNQAWINDRALWEKRQEWLAKNQPKFDASGQGNVHLLETLQGLAKDNNLTIEEPTLLDPKITPNSQEVSVQLRLIGSLESVCRLLATLQQPTKFHAINNLTIKSDADPTKVRCEMTVLTWNQTQSP